MFFTCLFKAVPVRCYEVLQGFRMRVEKAPRACAGSLRGKAAVGTFPSGSGCSMVSGVVLKVAGFRAYRVSQMLQVWHCSCRLGDRFEGKVVMP